MALMNTLATMVTVSRAHMNVMNPKSVQMAVMRRIVVSSHDFADTMYMNNLNYINMS